MEERRELKLSDSYESKNENPDLELKVTELNINPGYNEELMDRCKTLRDYMLLVSKIRNYSQEIPFNEAVEYAIDECIQENILAEFLQKNKSEVIKVSIYEYNAEKHIQQERDEAWEKGRKAGKEEGRIFGQKLGEERINTLFSHLIADNRIQDLKHSIEDKDYQERLMKEYGIK